MGLQGQLEKMAHDITSGPGLFDTIEIAVMGGAVGGLIGYLKDRNRKGATSAAMWGAGLGIAGQYLLFHALRPALRAHGFAGHAGPVLQVVPRFASRGDAEALQVRGEFVGNGAPPETMAGWGHGEMMGAVPYPYYYARHEMPGWVPWSDATWAWWE